MPNTTSNRLIDNINEIMNIWVERADNEIKAAHQQGTLALKDSLPEYLLHLGSALSQKIDRTQARKRNDKDESTRIGEKHGEERASSFDYTIDQLILEYHILRQVVCDFLEEHTPLTLIEREIIVCSIEQAVNNAATRYSELMKDKQESLTNTLSHDLLNPLNAAKLSAESIIRWPEDKNNCLESATRISRNMDRIKKLILTMLDTSRLNSGEGIPLKFKKCDLDLIVTEVMEETNLSFGPRLTMHSSGKCLGLWDEDGLRRLIENLAMNAIKYGNVDTLITTTLEQDEHTAILKMHNEGEPIPPNEISDLFQLFKRGSTTPKETGWGLGLKMVKEMVDAHRGSVTVESSKEKGTTFTVSLPKEREEDQVKIA